MSDYEFYLHLEFLDKDVTAQDTQSIADKNIQDKLINLRNLDFERDFYRVPPAFFKVREPVLESEFQEFKEDTQEHAESPISERKV